jgi:hypothetical protein
MKTKKLQYPRSPQSAWGAAVFLTLAGLFLGGCKQPLDPESRIIPGGVGLLSVSLSGPQEPAALTADPGAARTMLALDPEFSSYELLISPDPETVTGGAGTGSKTYSSSSGSFQIMLPTGTYTVSAAGYTGDKRTAKSIDDGPVEQVSISGGTQTDITRTLHPYMDEDVYGALHYSLNWDAVGQIPARAELLVEQYDDSNGGLWTGIPISLINESVTAGSQRGTILLIRRETGLVQQSGVLALPPGEYRLTTTVAMDGPNPPVSRTDIAHIFSNLSTPAVFVYGSGDLTVTGPGTDAGSGFITRFNFTETPGAVSIVGSSAGPDGTRLIMVMVPDTTDLTRLTPVVECAEGAQITSSPYPAFPGPDGKPAWSAGDYSRPTAWAAEGRNGVTQPYTVIVTGPASGDCLITNIAFQETSLAVDELIIDQANRSITVKVPNGTRASFPNYRLTPIFEKIGTDLKLVDPEYLDDTTHDSPLSGPIEFMDDGIPARIFRVYAQSGATKTYTVFILEALNTEAEIINFVFDGYPDHPGSISLAGGTNYTITVPPLPYGTPLTSLKPLITYKGSLNPGSGVEQNFSVPVSYTVTSENGANTKTYTVTVTTEAANRDTGIFDFVITNVPRAKVVIGTKPRADGKIPIVVQVPYATSPLTPKDSGDPDGPKWTDLKALIPLITLSSGDSVFINPNDANPSTASPISPPNGTTDVIPFNNQNNYQEAVYRIKAQAGNIQDYVVVAAREVQYYYVKASGDDTDPDQYNGGSESTPFRTLAYAVRKAVEHEVDHIYVIGTLNNSSEGGAWENTSATEAGDPVPSGSFGEFGSTTAPATGGGQSVFNLNGTGRNGAAPWRIYITGIGSNAILQGAPDKRVISVSGGAHITFENITIRSGGGGAAYGGNGGGMYIGGGSTVIWKSGSIIDSRALSGGGVYVDNSEFDFMTGSISGNTAAGSTATNFTTGNSPVVQGGGGVYLNGVESLFWLANGEISGNSTAGSGGGVLVNGSAVPDEPNDNDLNPDNDMPHNFIMSGGTVKGNTATGGFWPHGGGGVFTAKGVFEMMGGQIMNNTSTRQGGGVFVWSRAVFYMDGDSSVTANSGVGSSKAICSRGVTTLRGNAQADKVYIWNYSKGSWNNGFGDEFTLMEGARLSGLVLAFADDPQNNRNYINIVQSDRLPGGAFFTGGTDPITTIDLESRLNANGSFSTTATIDGDWLGKYLIKNGGNNIPSGQAAALIKRFPLGSYTSGAPSRSLSTYTLDTNGTLKKK